MGSDLRVKIVFHPCRPSTHSASTSSAPASSSWQLAELSPGEVTVRVHWSGINYKDALAGTGKGRILRRFPLVGGVDLAGVVDRFQRSVVAVGDKVLVTGCGLSETRDGGYAEYARVPADAVVKLPASLSLRGAMIVGTAGFAAALAITQLEHNGLAPGQGPVAVTGATGGVGLLAIDMLASRGYEVVAFTRKADSVALLHNASAPAKCSCWMPARCRRGHWRRSAGPAPSTTSAARCSRGCCAARACRVAWPRWASPAARSSMSA